MSIVSPEANPLIPKKLLLAAMEKSVSERLGGIFRDLGEHTKGMSEADAKEAKLMLIDMVEVAATNFCRKMKLRVERKEDQSE